MADETELIAEARKRIQAWEGHCSDWLKEARENYDIIAGRQWDESDRRAFEDANRPLLTMNNIAAMVRAICGLEINSRQQVTYFSRFPGVSNKAELLSAAAKWVRDECNAEDEESECFRDLVICGMAFTETRYVKDDNPAGEIWVERLDPLSVAWDISSRKRGCSDSRWMAAWRDIPMEEVERLWPDKADEIGMAFWPDTAGSEKPHDSTESAWYPSSMVAVRPEGTARVVQYQYFVMEPWVEVSPPSNLGTAQAQNPVQMPRERFAKISGIAQGYGLTSKKIEPRRRYRQAIVAGDVLLEDKPLAVEGFTLRALTGIRDRNEQIWYGFLRDLVDPQKFVNKMMSLSVEILSYSAKGGLIAESDAFVNPRSAEEDWSNPKKIVWLKPGGKEKVEERQAVQFPQALTQLMQFSVEGLPKISGLPLEFLGVSDRAQAGVLEYQRKQSAVAGLAELFASLRLYRKQHGKILAKFIATYLNDGRLVRVAGPDQAQYVPLVLDPNATEYDIVVDESPASPDTKARTWAALEQILPMALKAGIPVPPDILDYSPLPASLASKWKDMLVKAQGGPQQLPPQVQEQMKGMAEQMQKLQQENQSLKVGADTKIKQLQMEHSAKSQELQQSGQGKIAELQLKAQIAELEAQLAHERQIRELAQERERVIAELEVKREANAMALAIDREAAANKLQADTETAQKSQATQTANLSPVLDKLAKLTEAIDKLQAERPTRKVITLKREGKRVTGATVTDSAGTTEVEVKGAQGGVDTPKPKRGK